MAKGSGERGQLLPVSADDGKGNGGGGAADDAALFKGSAMTRRGAVAALSYMACSGTYHARSAPSPGGRFGCFLCFGGAVASSRVLVSVGGTGCSVRSCLRSANSGAHLHHVWGIVACASRHVRLLLNSATSLLGFVQDG
jgi:hypothetical protein